MINYGKFSIKTFVFLNIQIKVCWHLVKGILSFVKGIRNKVKEYRWKSGTTKANEIH